MVFSVEHIAIQVVVAFVAAFLIKIVGLSNNLPRLTAIAVVLMFLAEGFALFRYDTGLFQYFVTCARDGCPSAVSEVPDESLRSNEELKQADQASLTATTIPAERAPEEYSFISIFSVAPDRFEPRNAEVILTINGNWMKEQSPTAVEGGAYGIFGSDDGQSWGSMRLSGDVTISGLTYEEFERVLPPFLYVCTAGPLDGRDDVLLVEETHQLTDDGSAYLPVRPRSYSYSSTADQCFRRSLTAYRAPEPQTTADSLHQGTSLSDVVVPPELSGSLQFLRASGSSAYGPKFGPIQMGVSKSLALERLREQWPDLAVSPIDVATVRNPAIAITRPGSSRVVVVFGFEDADEIVGYSIVTNTFPDTPTFVDLQFRLTQRFGAPVRLGSMGGGTQTALWTAQDNEKCANSGAKVRWNIDQGSQGKTLPFLYLRNDWPGTEPGECDVYVSLTATDTPHVSQFDVTIGNTVYLTSQ